MIELIDSHSHFDVDAFDADRSAALERARRAGVMRQIVPAIAAAGFTKLRDICAQNAGLFAAYGLHPMYLGEHRPEHLATLRQWLENEGPVAIGECGLDFYVEGLDRDAQRNYFQAQLELAAEFSLPLIVHARRAFDDVTAMLRSVGGVTGVVHSFSGSQQQAEQLWKLGFCIGIGGPVTYERASRLRALVAAMPLEFLLLETDSPDQPLFGHQGARNEPALLIKVCRTVAMLRGIDTQVLALATTTNAEKLFRLPANVNRTGV